MKRNAILQLAMISVMLLLTGWDNENINNQNENKDSIVVEVEKEANEKDKSTAVYDSSAIIFFRKIRDWFFHYAIL